MARILVVSISKYDGYLAEFPKPLGMGCFCSFNICNCFSIFWFVGLIPDLATLRIAPTHESAASFMECLAMGWRGSTKHWHRYETAYGLLAALSTPLVVSVHTIVSFDFAVGLIPGWHATIFPPYFVAGAIYAGFAMVITLAIPIRAVYGLQDFITMRHLQNMAKIMLATGLLVAYGYMMETFMAWYSGNQYEKFMIINRMTGPYETMYWALIFCNVITPNFLWFTKIRNNTIALFIISMIVSIGMWLERFVIIVVSLHRDFLPSSWGMYHGTGFRLEHVHWNNWIVPDSAVLIYSRATNDFHF